MRVVLGLLALCVVNSIAHAQEDSCGPLIGGSEAFSRIYEGAAPGVGLQPDKETFDKEVVKSASENAVKAAQSPRAFASSTQRSAPAGSGTTSDAVDSADTPSIFALALDNNLISSKDRAVTISLTPFAYKALEDPDIVDRQEEYAKYEWMRRIGGSLTLGGKGEAFDRDGDGKVDDALEAQEAGDIVTWEARYRFFGSRDARDDEHVKKFREATRKTAEERLKAITELNRLWAQYQGTHESEVFRDEQICAKAVDRFKAENPEALVKVSQIHRSEDELDSMDIAARKAIERSKIWTFVLGGTQRKHDFGPDKQLLAIRGAFGQDDNGYTANIEYSRAQNLAGSGSDPKVFKVGLEWARLFLSGRVGAGKNNGLQVSAGAAYEKAQDVPDTVHDTTAKITVKVEWPVNSYITVPISFTWANHKDLLSEEKETRGYIGFTVDTSSLLDFKKPKAD